MASYKTNKVKLDMLVLANDRGEEINLETIPEIIGIKSKKAVEQYHEEFLDMIDTPPIESEEKPTPPVVKEKKAVVKKKTFATPPSITTPKKKIMKIEDYKFVVEDENGIEQAYELVAKSKSTAVLRKIEPILKNVMIGGVEKTVDLRELRELDPKSEKFGVKVSTLIVAAELA